MKASTGRRAGKGASELGFTLLELSLVVALIGLLATLIVPRLDVLTSAELDTSTRRIANRIRYLRAEAARRGIWVRLIFDAQQGSITSEEGVSTEEGWVFVPSEEVLYRPIRLPSSLKLAVGGPGIRSTVDGRPSAILADDGFADPMVIQVSDDSGRTVSVLIEPARARPRIIDGAIPGLRP